MGERILEALEAVDAFQKQVWSSKSEQGLAALDAFASRIRHVVREHEIEKTYNADHTGINYEYIPKKTIQAKGTKTVWVKGSGHEKDRLTAMLLADFNRIKYPIFMVLKKTASKIKEVVRDNLENRNGFGTTCKPVLLLWDDFSAHFTDEVVALAKELNVILEKGPPTFTWICQPADVAWMRPMKSGLRQRWLDYLREELKGRKGGRFNLNSPDRFDLVEWVNTVWENLRAQQL
ncbi:hypothetical protein DYB32_010920 [Aphanomyces invadans]|uniref:DDE-1 domain-containing protein n=1 Tax=Aphanomyces invadans TaxID=157072 RepID=A0A3R6XZ77_9STRA|nr:hypothetical protein DYB32_010920 [Aphanomyces invadans]